MTAISDHVSMSKNDLNFSRRAFKLTQVPRTFLLREHPTVISREPF
jgi:hypothetical protein